MNQISYKAGQNNLKIFLILSDIHSAGRTAANIIRKNAECSGIIFLGDGEEKFELSMAENGIDVDSSGSLEVYQVSGNCDWGSLEPSVLRPVIGGIRICVTHGHGFGVKSKAGIKSLAEYAAANDCKAALFGHTHRKFYEEDNGVKLFNPGAVQNGEYGIMLISGDDINFEHRNI